MNIRARLSRCVGRLATGFCAIVLTACSIAPGPDVVRIDQVLGPDGPLQLPHDWDRSFTSSLSVRSSFRVSRLDDSLGVALGTTTLAFRASVNGTMVHESGDAASSNINPTSYRARPSFRIPAGVLRHGVNELTLDLTLPSGTQRVLLGQLYIGPAESVDRFVMRGLIAHQLGPLAIGIVLFVVGMVSLGLWRGRSYSGLFMLLALGTLLWALQILLYQWPTRPLPRPHWSVFVSSLWAWFPTLIGVFFLRFAYRRSRGLEWFAVGLAVIAAPLLYAGFHLGLLEEVFIALRLAVLVFVSIALFVVLRYALELRTLTGYLLFAMGALCVGVGIGDFTVSLLGTDEHVVLNPYSGVALMLFAGWMLLERHHKAFADFEMLNRNLEQRVAAANVELHRRLEEVDGARAAAEQANVAKSRFFAAASHDLRQPLHSLGLFASALRDVVSNAEGRDLARRIGESINALNRLFDELLDISRLEAGTVEVRRRPIALQPLFDRLGDEFFPEAAQKDLRLRFHPTALAVETDPTLLERVLANLVSNAIRYTRSGGVLVGARRRGDSVLLQVWDTGIGIPPEQRSMIFEEFYQLQNPTRDPRKGLGLGLAIVRRLTALLDMPLDLASVAGRGTRFELRIPRASHAVAIDADDESLTYESRFDGRCALIVDDDAAIVEATERLLLRWGFQARSATHYDQARAVVDAGFEPDVILADLRLAEDLDGIRAIERLRERLGRAVPAVLISGDTGARELARVKESGLLLLTKPVAPARLRSALHALLAAERV